MTPRQQRFGPTWRKPTATSVDPETTIVLCNCGVDMEFTWPRGEKAVRVLADPSYEVGPISPQRGRQVADVDCCCILFRNRRRRDSARDGRRFELLNRIPDFS